MTDYDGSLFRLSTAFVAVLVAIGLAGGTAAIRRPDTTAAGGAIAPVMSCATLATADFSRVADARSVIASAVPTTANGHRYCDVRGTIAPRTHFDLKLPRSGWRGQYLQEGCEGLCGAVSLPPLPLAGFSCEPALDGQLALGTDDGGHTSTDGTDGSWAKGHPELRVVFGITSEHSLRQLARAVIARYYGRPPAYDYFDGCSTGGRQALMLVQRYPADFEGVIAGAAVSNLAPLSGMLNPWLIKHNMDRNGQAILTAEKLPALHQAVLKACGNSDGIIVDPRQCAFQPASIECSAGTDTDACLTPAQVATVTAVYRGPTDSAGRSLYNGGEAYGSELGWDGVFIAPAADTGAPADTFDGRIALSYLKYLGYAHDPSPGFTLANMQFTDSEFARLNVLGDTIYNANDPDLRAFRDHGGKLIMYHGWADPAAPPWSSIDYYAAMERTMGGFRASQAFSRLYMVPGGYHCLIGPDINAPTEVGAPDLLTPLIDWVQRRTAPGMVPVPTVSAADGSIIRLESVAPYNALAPIRPAAGSLNGHYHYIGRYRPGRTLAPGRS